MASDGAAQGHRARCKSFDKKFDAEKWARDLEALVDVAGYVPDTKIAEQTTLGDILTRYREEISPTKRSAKTETIRINAMLRHAPATPAQPTRFELMTSA